MPYLSTTTPSAHRRVLEGNMLLSAEYISDHTSRQVKSTCGHEPVAKLLDVPVLRARAYK